VFVTDINADAARETARAISTRDGRCDWLGLDVTVEDQWPEAVERASRFNGSIDVLHMNAGGNPTRAPLSSVTTDSWNSDLALNLDYLLFGVRQCFPFLRQSGHGAVVFTSSIHALLGFRGFPAYAASKGAMLSLARQLAVEFAPEIRVNAVVPGGVESPIWGRNDQRFRDHVLKHTPAGRIGLPEDVAAAVAFLASDDAAFITGQSLVVDGGRSIWSHE